MKKFLSVLLAVMMVLSTVSFAAPSLVGVADSAVEAPVADTSVVEEEATLAADISEDVDSYGTMIFEINFDDLTSIDSQKINLKDAGWINPDFDYTYNYLTEKATVSFSAWPTYAIKERATGDKYLELAGGTGYAVLLIESGTDRGFQGEDGVYTLTADVYRPNAMSLTTRFTASSSEDTPIQDFSALNDAGWGSIILQHDPSCYGNGGHATPMTSASQVKTLKFHRNGGTDDKTVGYDNIKLYYKPLTVDVTVKAGDKTVKKTVSTLESVSIASLAEELDLGVLYSVTSAKVGDKTYSYSDSLVFGKDSTVELTVEKADDKYIHSEYGLMIFDIDLENHNIGDDVAASNGSFKVGSYVTPIGEKVMSHPASNWHFNDSGYDIKVMADPANANNKVLGVTGATSTGYPFLMLTTYSNSASARYGWIEDNDLIWTVTADIYDTTADGVTLRFGGRSSVSENEGLAKWTVVEDVPTEGAITNKAASTWYTFKGTMNPANYSRMGGSDELSFIKFHSSSPTNADLYWDNIKLYYKPAHVDVTFADCGIDDVTIANKNLTNVSTAGLTVSSLLSMAGVDYSAVSPLSYTFKGVAIDGVEYGLNDTLGLLEDTTVSLVFEKVDLSEWTDENGILLYEVTFDGIENGTKINQGAKLHTFGRVNPYIEGSENWYFNLSGFGTVSGSDYGVVENGALKTIKTASGQWSQIQFSGETINGNNGCTMIADGTIYKEADMKLVTSVSGVTLGLTGYARKYNETTGKWEGGTGNQNSVQTIAAANVKVGEWNHLSGSKVLEGQEYNSESCTIFLPTYPAAGTTGDEFYLDNLRLYWKPAEANVTIEGGKNENFETVTLKNVSTSATIEEVIAMIPGSATDFGKITGLADENGVKLTDLGLVSDTTYQALWSPWVVVEGGQEFPVDAKGVSSGSSGQWTANYGNTNEVGNGGVVTGAVSWMYGNGWYSENGNMYRVQDTVAIGENNAGGTTATWSTPAVHSNEANGNIRDEIVTNLLAGNDAEYVLIKYRYTNLPDLAEVVANDPNPEGKKYTLSANGEELTYYDRTGAAQVFDMSPAYGAKYYIQRQTGSYSYGGGEEFHKNELFVEGEWLYDFLPVNADMKNDGVKKVLIQRYNLFDQMVTEYDYVRFVKLGEELDPVVPEQPEPEVGAPVTSDDTSYRLNAPNGIRFRADMTAATNTAASDYGWVVGRAAKGATEETLLIDAPNTITAYGRENGVDLKNFFQETDDLKTFTAVVYNIPKGNEDDVLCIKPFVIVDGEVFYGNMISKSPRQVAEAHNVDVSVLMRQ